MKRVWLVLLFMSVLSGCSLFSVERSYYRADYKDKPQKQELSFKSKQDMAAAATLLNKLAAEIHFKGIEAESEKSKVVYDLTYAFVDLAGVVMDVDPENLEDVTEILQNATTALKEKDEIIHKLEVDVKRFQDDSVQIKKDKEAELEALNGKWQFKMGSLWWWIKAIIIFAILGVVALGVIQVWTGIPILSAVFGGAKTLFKAAKQTMKGVQAVREELKKISTNGGSQDERQKAHDMLAFIDSALSEYQDEDVKSWIKTKKATFIPDKESLKVSGGISL